MNNDLTKELRAMYKKKLPSKMEKINSEWHNLLKEWDNAKIDELYKLIHMLTGSSGSYGYPEVSAHAKELENYLREIKHNNRPITLSEVNEIESKLKKISSVVNHILLLNEDNTEKF